MKESDASKGRPSTIEEALAAAARGWHVIPVKAGGKAPEIIDWYNRATVDPAQIRKWAKQYPNCNFGWCPGRSGHAVLDLDKGSDQAFQELTAALGELPDRPEVKTPGGGRHLIFEGSIKTTVQVVGAKIDTFGAGHGQLLLPGSRVKKGVYQWVSHPDVCRTPILPEAWAAKAPLGEHTPREDIPAVEWDLPTSIGRASDYLSRRAEPSVEGDGGDTNAFQVAARVRDYGVSEDMCLQLMMSLWNGRCEPPWKLGELAVKVRNAYEYAKGQAGAAAPEADFDAVPDEPEEDGGENLPWMDGDMVGTPPPREWVVDQWMPKGEISSLYGDGGQGKTLLAMQMAFCIAYGQPFMGLPTMQMPVLCVLAEDERKEIHRRRDAFRVRYGWEFGHMSGYLSFYSYPSESYLIAQGGKNEPLKKGPFYDKLKSYLARMPAGPKFLLLDTLADIFGGFENDRLHANQFVKVILRGLAAKYDATIAMLAHPSRSGMSGGDNLSGSTAWNNAVRNRLTLTPHKDIPELKVLTRVKSNYARAGETMTLKYSRGSFVSTSEPGEMDILVEKYGPAILKHITEAWAKKRPYGLSKNSSRPWPSKLLHIMNGDGAPLDRTILLTLTEHMIRTGMLVEYKNQKHINGLAPANLVEDDEN